MADWQQNRYIQMIRSMFDRVFNCLLRILSHVLLCPRAHYLNPEVQKNRLEEPSILVCNHTGHLDGVVLNTVFGKHRIHTLAAKDRFSQKGFGFFLRHTYCIPIDREHPDTSWLHESLKILKMKKESVAIYPEGRHGSHRRQLPFHSGVTTLAVMANVPILMVYLDGPFKFWHRSHVFVGTPFRIGIPQTGLSADFVNEQTHLLEQKMKDLMQDYIEKNSQVM